MSGLGGLLDGLLGGVLPGKPAGPLDPGKTAGGLPVVGDLLKTIGAVPVVGNIAQNLPVIGGVFQGSTPVPGQPGTPALPGLGDLGKTIQGLPVLGSVANSLKDLPLIGGVLNALLGATPQGPGTNRGTNPGGNPGTNPGAAPGNGTGSNGTGAPGVNGGGNIESNGLVTGVGGSYSPSSLVAGTAMTIYRVSGSSVEFGSLAKVAKLPSTGAADSSLAGIGMGALALGAMLLALLAVSKPKKVGQPATR